MKKIIISESLEKKLIKMFLNETDLTDEGSKRNNVRQYLKTHFFPIRGNYKENNKGDLIPNELFGQLNPEGTPIKDVVLSHERVFDNVQQHFLNLFSDRKYRDAFLNDTITYWYYDKIKENGNINQ